MWGSRPTRRRRLAGIASASIAALLFAGCGGDNGTEETALQIVTASAERTTGGGTARMETRSTMSLGSLGQDMELMSGDGFVDFDTGRATMTMSSQGLPGEMELRQIDAKTGFMTLPFIELPTGKQWIRVDAERQAENPFASAGPDPEGTLEILRGLIGEPEEVGRETLHDADVTHYTVTIELDRLFESAEENAEQLSGQLDSMMELGREMLPDESDGDLWIDDDGRIRKLQYTISMEIMGETMEATTIIEYYDFGVEFEVEEPPADEVVPWEDVQDQYDDMLSGTLTGDLDF